MKCAVVIPAAGSGLRFGSETPKQYLPLRGRPLIAYAVEKFLGQECVEQLIICASDVYHPTLRDMIREFSWRDVTLVEGGLSRQHSVHNGVRAAAEECQMVAIHDAVRPFFAADTFRSVLAAAASCGAALPVRSINETVHEVIGGKIEQTIDRDRLRAAQTPQCFRRRILLEALERAIRDGFVGTDEASLVAHYGHEVRAVEGDSMNLKITRPEDLRCAEANFELWSRP
ncbi:MAG: 2-C-methyl-D-erythritol 4-phosphate cytidylyltransferase [Thermoanaerobaculia bacterium]